MSFVTHKPGLEEICPVCLLEIKRFRTSISTFFFLNRSKEGKSDQIGAQKEKRRRGQQRHIRPKTYHTKTYQQNDQFYFRLVLSKG